MAVLLEEGLPIILSVSAGLSNFLRRGGHGVGSGLPAGKLPGRYCAGILSVLVVNKAEMRRFRGEPVNRGTEIIFLVGARASGKTSVGRRLAEVLVYDFTDTDAWLREREGRTVAELVAGCGWAGFRELESAALREAGSGARRVVATGGGMVLAAANRAFMRAGGLVFYLAAPAEVLAARLAAAPEREQRPSLTGRPAEEEAARVLAEREALYLEAAHEVVAADAPLERVVADILRSLQSQAVDH
jgi:shikimate kinase